MWRVAATAAAMACGSCDRGATTAANHVERDPCALVSQTDATSLLGGAAVHAPSDQGACVWDHELADHARWSLRLEIKATASLREPVIFVTKSAITYDGRPIATDSSIAESMAIGSHGFITASDALGVDIRWFHADRFVELALVSSGPAAPSATTRIDAMKRLARKVDAAL